MTNHFIELTTAWVERQERLKEQYLKMKSAPALFPKERLLEVKNKYIEAAKWAAFWARQL